MCRAIPKSKMSRRKKPLSACELLLGKVQEKVSARLQGSLSDGGNVVMLRSRRHRDTCVCVCVCVCVLRGDCWIYEG